MCEPIVRGSECELAGDASHVTSQGKLALRCLCWALFMDTGWGRRPSRARKSYMEQMGASCRATSLYKSERSALHSRTTAITSTQFISTFLTRWCVVWLAITTSFILFLAYLPSLKTKTVDRRHDFFIKRLNLIRACLSLFFPQTS